ncbi:hypothetical protein AWZ03_004781 [Drosophila navojoa]|uniref:MYND-type domain-containing protein n=1 Tax=Drosophila navojoa TaxID=7232 RepID=A0A484BJF4_DRONA|nr:hypothetical protein AWZ03_004781 [Drosophila navojoa]
MQKPQSSSLPARCAICGTAEQLLRCAKCKSIYYCSVAHQHLDWPAHRHDCRLLARQKQNNNNKIQQLQQAVAATTLDVSGANCSTAQMMTTAAQAQSWPNELDDLFNYFGEPTLATQTAQSDELNQQHVQQHHHPHPHQHHNHHGEKSSSFQIGLTDSSFMGSGR